MCIKKFVTSAQLKAHVKTHTGEKPYACDMCSKRFAQMGQLQYHTRTHLGDRKFACTLCERKYYDKSGLERHMLSHTGEKPFSCEICGKAYSRSATLNKHLRSVHRQNLPVKCSSKLSTPNVNNLAVRCNSTNQIGNTVKKIDLINPLTRNSLNFPMNGQVEPSHFNANNVYSDVTDKSSMSKVHIIYTEDIANCKPISQSHATSIPHHSDIELNISVNPVETLQLDAYAPSIKPLLQPSSCLIHDESFDATQDDNDRDIDSHSDTSTIINEPLPKKKNNNMCIWCHRKFISKQGLKRHLEIHTGDKRYRCKICDKKFTQSTALLVHNRRHTGEKPFRCLKCGKCFAQSGALKLHSRVHSGEKPYKCSICNKTFSQAGTLQVSKAQFLYQTQRFELSY